MIATMQIDDLRIEAMKSAANSGKLIVVLLFVLNMEASNVGLAFASIPVLGIAYLSDAYRAAGDGKWAGILSLACAAALVTLMAATWLAL